MRCIQRIQCASFVLFCQFHFQELYGAEYASKVTDTACSVYKRFAVITKKSWPPVWLNPDKPRMAFAVLSLSPSESSSGMDVTVGSRILGVTPLNFDSIRTL